MVVGSGGKFEVQDNVQSSHPTIIKVVLKFLLKESTKSLFYHCHKIRIS